MCYFKHVLDAALRNASGADDSVLRQHIHLPQLQALTSANPSPNAKPSRSLDYMGHERNGGKRMRLLAVPNGNIRPSGRRC